MRNAIGLALVAVLLIIAGTHAASAHHVEVAAAESDREAHVSYVAEYVAQRIAVGEAIGLYQNATSADEKADALLLVETALTAGIAHLESLDVRPCFAQVATVALIEFNAFADGIRALRAEEDTTAAGERFTAAKALMDNPIFAEIQACEGSADEVTA